MTKQSMISNDKEGNFFCSGYIDKDGRIIRLEQIHDKKIIEELNKVKNYSDIKKARENINKILNK